MAVLYKTAAKAASAEQIIEKSRFISYITPVADRQEAEDFIESIRQKHKDATHNVPAFVIGDKQQLVWGSDDGEPGGTAGSPVALFLANQGITNVCCVVTRYFGGIKLGPGGLVRAYTSSVKLALEQAGIREVKEMCNLKVRMEYAILPKLQTLEKQSDFEIKNIEYTDKVDVAIAFEPENKESIMKMLNDISSGFVLILEETLQSI